MYSILGWLIYVTVMIIVIAGIWKAFEKAGKPGWASLVPIYNFIILLEMAKKPLWWIVFVLFPPVLIVLAIIVNIEIAQKFSKGAGFGLGLSFLGFIFWPVLGFGDAQYQDFDGLNPNVLDSGI